MNMDIIADEQYGIQAIEPSARLLDYFSSQEQSVNYFFFLHCHLQAATLHSVVVTILLRRKGEEKWRMSRKFLTTRCSV